MKRIIKSLVAVFIVTLTINPLNGQGQSSTNYGDNKEAGNFNIRIMNSSGVLVKQIASAQNQWQGNVSNLLTGTYIIEVVNNKDKSLVGQTRLASRKNPVGGWGSAPARRRSRRSL